MYLVIYFFSSQQKKETQCSMINANTMLHVRSSADEQNLDRLSTHAVCCWCLRTSPLTGWCFLWLTQRYLHTDRKTSVSFSCSRKKRFSFRCLITVKLTETPKTLLEVSVMFDYVLYIIFCFVFFSKNCCCIFCWFLVQVKKRFNLDDIIFILVK